MMTSDDFRQKVDRFLERTGMSATRFGKEAVGDPNFVFDLRAGRAPTLRMAERVSIFMRDAKLPEGRAA
jgi:hypothetical protein